MAKWRSRKIDAPDKPYLTRVEVMDLLGVDSRETLRDMIRTGQLPRPLRRHGTDVWGWRDIVLANLLMEAADRMERAGPEQPPEGLPNLDQKRPNVPKRGDKRPSTSEPLNPDEPGD